MMLRTPDPRRHALRAFSLMELSIVLVIFAVLATLGLEGAATYMQRTAHQTTLARLAAIDDALVRYRRVHGKLPCPSSASDPLHACYGKEHNGSHGAGTCNNTAGACHAAGTTTPGALYGYVPVRDLGLPMHTIADGWGSMIQYVVTADQVYSASYHPLQNFERTADAIRVRSGKLDANCGTSSSLCQSRGTASYFLFSVGPDQRGGTSVGGNPMKPCFASPPDADDGKIDSANCRFTDATPLQRNGTATINPALSTLIFYDSSYNDGPREDTHFDDLVQWRSKGNL